MEDIEDFVGQFFTPERPPRKGGDPMLIPGDVDLAEGEIPREDDPRRERYSRASGLADYLEDFSFLWKWKMRGLAKGLADRVDLARLVAAETYTTGFADDEAENRAAGRRIDEVIERAMDHSGTDMKADYGTAIHSRTEYGNQGIDIDDKQEADVDSCWDLWNTIGVVHLGTEVFTANDITRSAGTFDNLSFVPTYGIVVTDKKTSSKAKQNYDIQLASYSHSDVYDPETDRRMSLEEYIASKGWDPALLNRKKGIVWWVKGGKTQARELDLEVGWRWAQVAASVRDERRPQASRVARDVTKTLTKDADVLRGSLLYAIREATSVEHLNAIWSNKAAQAIWNDIHTNAFIERREAL